MFLTFLYISLVVVVVTATALTPTLTPTVTISTVIHPSEMALFLFDIIRIIVNNIFASSSTPAHHINPSFLIMTIMMMGGPGSGMRWLRLHYDTNAHTHTSHHRHVHHPCPHHCLHAMMHWYWSMHNKCVCWTH